MKCPEISNLLIPQAEVVNDWPLGKQIRNIYGLLVKEFGEIKANEMVGLAVKKISAKSGASAGFKQFVQHFPLDIVFEEQIAVMSKEEIAHALKEKVQELRTMRRDFEDELGSRTRMISAERNKLAVMLSAIGDSVIGLDLMRNIVIVNNSAMELVGLNKEQMLGKKVNEVFKLFDKTIEIDPRIFAPDKTNFYEGVVFTKENLRLINARGQQKSVSVNTSQIAEGLEVNLGCIITIRDNSKEEQLERMKLDFVSMAAHELRTPLTALNSYLYVFIKENGGSFNAEQNKFLNRMNISTQQLMSLVENLLSVSRIERGVFKVYLEPMEWISYVKEYIEEMTPRARERNIALNFFVPKTPIHQVMADKSRINEVLLNLLANALAYTEPGGKIDVTIEEKNGEVITRVADTGQGIPEDALPHLFSKFYRVSGKLEQGSKGTGLGLFICKAIVEAHHGRIFVESKVSLGSTFGFGLPIANGK